MKILAKRYRLLERIFVVFFLTKCQGQGVSSPKTDHGENKAAIEGQGYEVEGTDTTKDQLEDLRAKTMYSYLTILSPNDSNLFIVNVVPPGFKWSIKDQERGKLCFYPIVRLLL